MVEEITQHKRGRGRPKGSKGARTVMAEKAKEELVKDILKVWKPLIKAKKDLALGLYKERLEKNLQTKEPIIRIYQQNPDGGAIEELINRVVGKPKDSIEIGGDKESLDKIEKLTVALAESLRLKK